MDFMVFMESIFIAVKGLGWILGNGGYFILGVGIGVEKRSVVGFGKWGGGLIGE